METLNITLLGGTTVGCTTIAKLAAKDGGFNYKAFTTAGVATTTTGTIANASMDAHYQNLLDKYSAETTTAYVQQLSDEELESALMQFDLLESEDKNDVKVL